MRPLDMARMCVTRAKRRAGAGWDLLGSDLRQALVAREVLAIISANRENAGWERAGELVDILLSPGEKSAPEGEEG